LALFNSRALRWPVLIIIVMENECYKADTGKS